MTRTTISRVATGASTMRLAAVVLAMLGATGVGARERPAPPALPGHHAITSTTMKAGTPSRSFVIVAYARDDETRVPRSEAPPRPLVIYERRQGGTTRIARNDAAVMRLGDGGQCDPFETDGGEGRIAVTGRFLTIENGVACGQHWTHFVTFRLDDRHGFVFHREHGESWRLNDDDRPNAQALVRIGPARVVRAKPGKPVPFALWRDR